MRLHSRQCTVYQNIRSRDLFFQFLLIVQTVYLNPALRRF